MPKGKDHHFIQQLFCHQDCETNSHPFEWKNWQYYSVFEQSHAFGLNRNGSNETIENTATDWIISLPYDRQINIVESRPLLLATKRMHHIWEMNQYAPFFPRNRANGLLNRDQGIPSDRVSRI
jgi:hypothetical protein